MLLATLTTAGLLLGAGSATTDPAEQFGTETQATNISCTAYGPTTYCYGVGPDGAVVGSSYVDGAFTAIAPAAPVEAPVGTAATAATGDVAGAQSYIDMLVASLDLDLMTMCPIIESNADLFKSTLHETFDADPTMIETAAEYGVPTTEFVDMVIVTVGNRLVTEC